MGGESIVQSSGEHNGQMNSKEEKRPRCHDSRDDLTLEHDTFCGLMVSITVPYFPQ